MGEARNYTVLLLPQPEGGFTVSVPALPEVVTEGDTVEGAMAMAREAIELVLETYAEEGWPAPDDAAPVIESVSIAA